MACMIDFLVSIIAGFLSTFILTRYWIRRAKAHRLTAPDMHKPGKNAVELGGLCIVSGFLIGMLIYIGLNVFIFDGKASFVYLFAALVSILIATMLGFADDILRWKIGLRQYQKALLSIAISFPMIAVNAGHSTISIPFIGHVNIGLLYPLLAVPIGIVGASNGFNMIAGFNGLESGMGIIILSTLGIIAWQTKTTIAMVLAFCMVAALLAFYYFNKCPARVFPGDSMTYSVGTLIAIVAIVGNIEKFALILFIPYFIQFLLKSRGFMLKESFGKVLDDGSLEKPYDKFYAVEHLAISFLRLVKKQAFETDVTALLLVIEGIFAIVTLFVFF
jgi:UDP-N-acetylglucosamine--dolichyl-phosphate N-acetylglucosaminephosphotransferase